MLPLAFLSFLSLVLQFDGSHRPPKDFGFPTDSMRKLPSCSSAILVDSDEKVLALGGKLIPVNIGMTSADAEYDGLLVGLEWLGKQDEDWWTQHTATSKTLTIRGDNKAIIDQLRGSALPRKLNEKHQNGQQILETIQKHFTTFNYEHVLRNQNVLCDAVCGDIIQLSVSRILNTFQTDVKACTNASPDGETDKRKRKATTSPLATIIQSYLNEASAIPHSIRPAILKQLIHKAESLSDGYALVAIGELLEAESKLWADCGARVVPGSHDCRELLLVQGLQLQMKGWTLRRNEKEAGKISRKHKFNLNQYGNMVTPTPVGVWPTMLQESSKVPAYVVWSERAEKMFLHGPSDEQHNAIWVEKLL
jgi:ribonuclease HI